MLFKCKNYREYLKWILADRIGRNSQYSLRAFARSIGVHHSMLVQVFQGKKRLSVDRAHQVAHRLELQGKEYEYFCLLVEIENSKTVEQKAILISRIQEISPESDIRDLDVQHFQMISDWYHIPIVQLVDLPNFPFTISNIARALSISRIEAEVAVNRLMELELIAKDDAGRYRNIQSRFLTQSKVPAEALRNFHRQMLQKATDSLVEQDPIEKWVGSETFAFDSRDLPEANEIIEQFFDRMVQLSRKGENRDHVYHLGTQLFRLTQKNPQGSSYEVR